MSTAIIIAVLLHVRGEALKEKNSRILPTDKGNIIPIMNPRRPDHSKPDLTKALHDVHHILQRYCLIFWQSSTIALLIQTLIMRFNCNTFPFNSFPFTANICSRRVEHINSVTSNRTIERLTRSSTDDTDLGIFYHNIIWSCLVSASPT